MLLSSLYLRLMRPKLAIKIAFFYHNLCAPNLLPHPLKWQYFSGGITQILISTELRFLVILLYFFHRPELLVKILLRGAL